MLRLFVLYTHLVATCVAIGLLVLTDLKMLGRAAGQNVVFPPPSPSEMRLISAALAVLYATGGVLILFGSLDRLDYLANQKLLAKLVLVGLLTLNALVLHFRVFPHLRRGQPVGDWAPGTSLLVSLAVGLSTTLWLYSAFLGIARPWNFQKSMGEVLIIAVAMWLAMALGVRLVLIVASREVPQGKPNWVDRVKHLLGHLSPVLGENIVRTSETVPSRISERDAQRAGDGDGAANSAPVAVRQSPTLALSLGASSRPRRLSLVGWAAGIGLLSLGTALGYSEWHGSRSLVIETSSSQQRMESKAVAGAFPDSRFAERSGLMAGRDRTFTMATGTPISDAGQTQTPASPAPADASTSAMPLPATESGQADLPEVATLAQDKTDTAKRIVLQFTGPCWVDIRDASKQFRLTGEMSKGAQRTLAGIPPYSVHLGNTSNVRITIDGKPFYIPKRRFTVDPGKLNVGDNSANGGTTRRPSPANPPVG